MCGVGHMTIDEIKNRMLGSDRMLSCPECGKIHLPPEDLAMANQKLIVSSPRYSWICGEAESKAP